MTNEHGTSVSYLATKNNPNVEIIPYRFGGRDDFLTQVYLSVKSAVEDHDAKIVNMSLSIDERKLSKHEKDVVLEQFYQLMRTHENVIFIMAAMNDGKNINKVTDKFPQAWDLPNMIIVGNVDSDGKLWNTSNYGNQAVDFGAIGAETWALSKTGCMHQVSGTSFSAPKIANIAAQILYENPHMSAADIKEAIANRLTLNNSLKGIFKVNGYMSDEAIFNPAGGTIEEEPACRR